MPITVRSVRAQVDRLRPAERVDYLLSLVEQLVPPADGRVGVWPDLTLSEHQGTIFRALYAAGGRTVSRDALMAAIYWDRDEPTERTIDVQIWHLRQKLRGRGATIRNVREIGWYLDREPGHVFPWEILE